MKRACVSFSGEGAGPSESLISRNPISANYLGFLPLPGIPASILALESILYMQQRNLFKKVSQITASKGFPSH